MNLVKKSIMFFLMIIMFATFTVPAFAQGTATVNIPVTSSYTGVPTGGEETLSYVLKADDAAFPMPEGSVNGEKTASVTGSGDVTFGDIVYSRVGIYTYKIYQMPGSDPFCTYDSIVYSATVSVVNSDDDGLLAVLFLTRADSEFKWQIADFVNQYYGSEDGITVVKSSNKGTVKPGETLIYTITVTNNGNNTVHGIRIRDYIPEYTLFVSINDEYGKFSSINDNDYITWFIPVLNPGEKVVLSFTVMVDDCLPNGACVKNTALYEVTGDETPPDPNDPSNPGSSTNEVVTPQPSVTPQTGDDQNIMQYIVMILISVVAFTFCVVVKRRDMRDSNKGRD